MSHSSDPPRLRPGDTQRLGKSMVDYAHSRGYKFRAGLIKASTSEEVNLSTEREIFAFLGLKWVPPEYRNADG